jgi:hypothetical protein
MGEERKLGKVKKGVVLLKMDRHVGFGIRLISLL